MHDQLLRDATAFHVTQKITLMVNRYRVTVANPDGSDGPLVAFAQQKRMAFKEQVTVYTGEDQSQPLFGFRARQALDLGASYDVYDGDGSPIGLFRKNFGASLLRSTWHLEQPGLPEVTGRERSVFNALLRRFTDLDFLPYHFDFTHGEQPVMSLEKRWALRDRYLLRVENPALDRRLAIAMAVALDALQAR